MRSNLWFNLDQASAIAVVLDSMHSARRTFARSEFGTTAGASLLMPTLNPVGHQSTNCTERRALIPAMAALASFGTTSPRYKRQHDMYLPEIQLSKCEINTVATCSRVAFDKLSARLEASVRQLSDGKRLVEGFFGRDDRRVGRKREVDPRVGNQVRLELVQIHIERALEPKRGRDRGDNLRDNSVEVAVRRALDA